MILDTSALVAILKLESGYEDVATVIRDTAMLRMSAATLLEYWIVTDRSLVIGVTRGAGDLLTSIRPRIEPFTEAQVAIARQAYRQFGKGSDHRARLNFGDCFSYALAREKNEPLLFVGDDFTHTDIGPALIR